MQRGTDGPLQRESAASDEDAERREERPEETLPSIAERVLVIGRAECC